MSGLRAKLERWLSPNLSTCFRCLRPWKSKAKRRDRRLGPNSWRQLDRDRFFGLVGVEPHVTDYGSGGCGCFPLCETCWAALGPSDRIPYYDMLMRSWAEQGTLVSPETANAIRVAVMVGR